jgi:hypothetical protein
LFLCLFDDQDFGNLSFNGRALGVSTGREAAYLVYKRLELSTVFLVGVSLEGVMSQPVMRHGDGVCGRWRFAPELDPETRKDEVTASRTSRGEGVSQFEDCD